MTSTLASTATNGLYVATINVGGSTHTENWQTSLVNTTDFTLTRVGTSWGDFVGKYTYSTQNYVHDSNTWNATTNAPGVPTRTNHKDAQVVPLPTGMYTDADDVKTELQTTLNASTKWGGSSSTFVVTIPGGSDNILKLDVSKTDGTRIDEEFNIIAENDLRRQGFSMGTWKAYGGADYDNNNPLSCNQLFG